ncbi:MAG TPA: nitroreductase [Puia sp.]|nr:nitroreductase [Puia sp.]
MSNLTILREIVINRRSTKPAAFNGKPIEDQQVSQLLELANWAPSHGLTEPWRFIVYGGDAVRQFCRQHAEQYRESTEPEKFASVKYEKQLHNGDLASHLVLVYMRRGSNPNISVQEEICATAAAVQNILLGAETMGLAVLWSTGGTVLQPAMHDWLGLGPEDRILGLLYLGHTDEPRRPGKRSPIADKVKWVSSL